MAGRDSIINPPQLYTPALITRPRTSLYVEIPLPDVLTLYRLRKACIPYPSCPHYTVAYSINIDGTPGDAIAGWPGECYECPEPLWWDENVPWCWFTTQALTTTGTGNSWTVSGTWNNANNTCEAIGSGGSGFKTTSNGGGGGGGAYAIASNVTLSGTASYNIGAGGSTTATQFNNSSTLVADYGRTPSSSTGAAGGLSTNCTPTAGSFSGGTGGSGTSESNSCGGGAGSAGPSGAGKNGGAGSSSSLSSGGGGGGSNGGSSTAGSAGAGTNHGGDGGNGNGGSGGGTGGNGAAGGNATANSGGGGGGGGNGGGGAGATSLVWASNYGPGGGGGGGGSSGGAGGAAASYGGAGGGSHSGSAGAGGQGIIFLTWTPLSAFPYRRQRSYLCR